MRSEIKMILVGSVLGFLLVGCAGTSETLSGSMEVPAATGEVNAKVANNGNTQVDVEVEHLARPEFVDATATTYVVWARDHHSGQVTNLGALKVNEDLEGKMTSVTPYKQFDVFVTPEEVTIAPEPSGERVLWARVSVD